MEVSLKIISRHAHDSLAAFHTAQGMENAGASVFSITHDGMDQKQGALIPSSRFIVWAKYDGDVTTDAVDAAISLLMYGPE